MSRSLFLFFCSFYLKPFLFFCSFYLKLLKQRVLRYTPCQCTGTKHITLAVIKL